MGALKISRPLSILLCFIILISSFTVTVYGADDVNLIDSEFINWTVYEGNVTINSYSDFNTIVVRPSELNGGSLPFVSIYDLPSELEIGHKYQLTFNVRDNPDYIGGGQGIIGIKDCFDLYGGVLGIGLASLVTVNDNSFYQMVEGCYVAVTEDNYNNFLNNLTNYTFEMPSGLVNPCIMISFYTYIPEGATDVNSSVYLVFSDGFTFVDLDTIAEDNFFSRLFEWFEVKFKAIGDSFSALGDKLVDLKDDFTESISNLGNSIKGFFEDLGNKFNTAISSLGDSIGSFFTKLGNLILYASWSEEPPENPFVTEDKPMSSLATRLKAISDSFASSGESFQNVIDSITGPVYLLDEFTKEFGWILGILVFTLAVIVISRFIGL